MNTEHDDPPQRRASSVIDQVNHQNGSHEAVVLTRSDNHITIVRIDTSPGAPTQ